MADSESRWIDAFLGAVRARGGPPIAPGRTTVSAQVGQPHGDAPRPSEPQPLTSFSGSDLIGIGYLNGPGPDDVRAQVAGVFGLEPGPPPALERADLWR